MSKIGTGVLHQTGETLHILVKNGAHSYMKCRAGMKTGIETEREILIIWLEDPAGYIQERFSVRWIDERNGIQAIYGLRTDKPDMPVPFALLFMRGKGWNKEKVAEWLRSHPKYLSQKMKEALRKYPRLTAQRLREGRRPLRARTVAAKRKKSPAPIIRLLPAPLPKNSAGFGKTWIGDDLCVAADDRVIPRAALDSMRQKGR